MAQFHFLDMNDARRPSEFPRISERYRAETMAVWYPPSRRKLFAGKPQPIEVHVVDLSVAGALFGAPTNPAMELGSKVKVQFDEVWGVSVIRNVRASSSPALSFYGVSFFQMSTELEMKVMDLVVAIKSTS
ncbi:MAG: PilZ domain-containing protein [Actinomycetota bacterium]|nr:PilZ domain-containing protein [Actinomycetota bacterium]